MSIFATVTRLPTASPRKVRQYTNKASRAARQQLREAQPIAFDFKFPGVRAAEGKAAVLATVERTPALVLAEAILSVMDRETREKVIEKLAPRVLSETGRQAFEIATTTTMSLGEKCDLSRALQRIWEA